MCHLVPPIVFCILTLLFSGCLGAPPHTVHTIDQDTAIAVDLRHPSPLITGGQPHQDGRLVTAADTVVATDFAIPVNAKAGTFAMRLRPDWPTTKGKHTLARLEFESGEIRLERALNLLCLVGGAPDDLGWVNAPTALDGWDDGWHELAITWNYADGFTALDIYADGQWVTGFLSSLMTGNLTRLTLGGVSVDPQMAIEVSHLQVSAIDRLRGGETATIDVPPTARLLQTTSHGAVWHELASRKVRPDQPAPTAKAPAGIELQAAANEYEAFQVVVSPTVAGELSVTVDLPTLGDVALPLELRYAEYVQVTHPSGRFGGTGWFPDPLPLVREPLQLKAGENTILWCTVEVPADTPAGLYSGQLLLQVTDTVTTIPIRCRIRDFALPADPSITAMSHLWIKYALEHDKSGLDRETMIRQYALDLKRHRFTSETTNPIDSFIRPGHIDKAAIARELDFWFNTCGFRYVSLHPLGWISHRGTHKWPEGTTWRYNGELFFTDETTGELNPAFTEPFRAFWQEVIATFDELGYTDRMLIWYQDEQNWDHAPTLRKSVAMARFLKSIDDRPLILQTRYPHPELRPYTDIWCQHGDHLEPYAEEIAAARAAGSQIWSYTNAVPLIDYPSIRTRLLPWALWKQGLDGHFSWWAVTYYMQDPWASPWKRLAGSGVLLYPARHQAETFPIPSMRWQLLREGHEDYEYLVLLEKRLAAAQAEGRHGSAVQAAETLLEEARQMTTGLPKANASDQPYNLDPAVLHDLRDRLAEAIEALSPTP